MPHSSEISPLSEEEIRNMEKASEQIMTWEEKEASNKREERFIELGKDGSLGWLKGGPPAWWYDKDGVLKKDRYPAETIIGKDKGHQVVIKKLARVCKSFDGRDLELWGPYTYEGSVDGDVELSARDAEKLFQQYSGMASDEEMEQLETRARESVKREGEKFTDAQRHKKIVSDLLNE